MNDDSGKGVNWVGSLWLEALCNKEMIQRNKISIHNRGNYLIKENVHLI
jgi:hypothetical protein